MSKPIRITLIVLGAILLIIVLGGATAFVAGGRILNRTLDLPDETLTAVDDSASIARGEHLATIWGCNDCHAANMGGQVLIDVAPFAYLVAANLTTGSGGLGGEYRLAEFEQAVRHGVGRDGRLLMIMPSMDYRQTSDEDIAALFAYLKTLAPVDNDVVGRELGPIGRLASLMSGPELFPASAIEHDASHVESVEPGVTAEYGGYLAGICVGCHGPDYAGIEDNGPNLTPDSTTGLGSWTLEDFKRAFQQGERPDGATLDSAMPWFVFDHMTEDEVEAVWMFLSDLEPMIGVARTEN